MRRRNPTPDAPWIERIGRVRLTGEYYPTGPIGSLTWIDTTNMDESDPWHRLDVWELHIRIYRSGGERLIFEHAVDDMDKRLIQYRRSSVYDINLGPPGGAKKLNDSELRTMGIEGKFILDRMLVRWNELRT